MCSFLYLGKTRILPDDILNKKDTMDYGLLASSKEVVFLSG